jgi:hypothetical protein
MATNEELVALLANKLAEMDHMDEDALFSLRWSGGPEPEPLGDAWNMDYLPKGEQLAAVVGQRVRTLRLALAGLIDFWHEHGHHGDMQQAVSHAQLALEPLPLFLRNPWQRDPAQPCDRFSREQIMDAMIEAEVGDGAFKTMLLKMDELEAQARQTLAGRERWP